MDAVGVADAAWFAEDAEELFNDPDVAPDEDESREGLEGLV